MKDFLLNLLEKLLVYPARKLLNKNKPNIIAVTGSVAKSSTKEAIFNVLENLPKRISKTYGSLNTKYGIPLAILGFTKAPISPNDNPIKNIFWIFYLIIIWIKFIFLYFSHNFPEIFVIEISADKPGDIKKICTWLKADIAVYTKIVPAHLEFFKTTKGIFNEKKQLAKSLSKDSILLLNKKDPRSSNISRETKAKVIYYDNNETDLSIQAAKKIGEIFDIEKSSIEKSLREIKPLSGRLNMIQLNNYVVIDDSYNANPGSVGLALDVLKNYKGDRKIAILGAMAELGDYTEKAHGIISKKAKEKSDVVFLIGESYYENRNTSNGWYLDSQEFIDKSDFKYEKGDIILVKGSRSAKMEKIVQYLKNKLGG